MRVSSVIHPKELAKKLVGLIESHKASAVAAKKQGVRKYSNYKSREQPRVFETDQEDNCANEQ